MRFILSVFALTFTTNGARIKTEKLISESKSSVISSSALGLTEGDVFINRFELLDFIGQCAHSIGLQGAKEKVPFPEQRLGARFCTGTRFWSSENPEFLGSGSFGETWRVRDRTAKQGSELYGKDLALKMFYITDKTGKSYHITRRMLQKYPQLQERYDETIKECRLARDIQKQVGGSAGPPGSNALDLSDLFEGQEKYHNHKCCCPDSDEPCTVKHVRLGEDPGCGSLVGWGWHSHSRHGSPKFFKNRTRTGCVVGEKDRQAAVQLRRDGIMTSLFMKCYEHGDSPVYVLLSYGGSQTLSDYLHTWSPTMQHTGMILKQMLQGLQVLSWAIPPLIHHDLKSENIVVQEVDGQPHLMIIDFGGMQRYTSKNTEDEGGASSLHISAPEWSEGKAYEFCGPAVSASSGILDTLISFTRGQPCNQAFDIYSTGNILAEIFTTATVNLWMQHPLFGVAQQIQEAVMNQSPELISLLKKAVAKNLTAMLPLAAQKPAIYQIDAPAMAFMTTHFPRMVAFRARSRPTASELLHSEWLSRMPDRFSSH